jgi:hypothetical protein
LPILNIVGGPKVKLGTRNLKEPKPIRAAGMTELLQASQVRNSSLVNFRIRRLFVAYSWSVCRDVIAILVPQSGVRSPHTMDETATILTESKKKMHGFPMRWKISAILGTPSESKRAPRKFLESLDEARRTG